MILQIYFSNDLGTKSILTFELLENKAVDKIFLINVITFLLSKDKIVINNNVRDFDMETLSKNKLLNVTILKNINFLRSNDIKHQDDLVIKHSTFFWQNWWSAYQELVVITIVIIVIILIFGTILWFKKQMIQSEKNKKVIILDDNHIQLSSRPSQCSTFDNNWACHTVINIQKTISSNFDPIKNQTSDYARLDFDERENKKADKKVEANIKVKGLLERRGSSASLTIDLPQSSNEKIRVVSPTQECTSEEFLQSAGNILSRTQLRNCLINVQNLHREFWEIPLNHPEKSLVVGCGTKNRYQSILPNEKTRVRLNKKEMHSLDAYINANYIRGYDGKEKAFIATQGPLSNTVEDLYKMIWNEKSPIIVMITELYEKEKVKCELYFPTEVNETVKYGSFCVKVIKMEKKDNFSIRELLIENGSNSIKVLHYWFDSWPDHKTPSNAHGIVGMAVEIEKSKASFRSMSLNCKVDQSSLFGPIIVHCSAGIGRTGCFIAISLAIAQLLAENQVDILGIVCQMRCDRGGMIQTAEQYEFVHRAIALFERSLPNSVK